MRSFRRQSAVSFRHSASDGPCNQLTTEDTKEHKARLYYNSFVYLRFFCGFIRPSSHCTQAPGRKPIADRRKLIHTFLSILLLALSSSAQTANPSQPITDPKQITSKILKREVQPFSIEKLFMSRSIGDADWSPDGKQVAFISNISGRNN